MSWSELLLEIKNFVSLDKVETSVVTTFGFLGFSQDLKEFTRSALEDIIDVVYKTTSKRLLEVLFDRYKFLEHLQVNCLILVKSIYCLLGDYVLRGRNITINFREILSLDKL